MRPLGTFRLIDAIGLCNVQPGVCASRNCVGGWAGLAYPKLKRQRTLTGERAPSTVSETLRHTENYQLLFPIGTQGFGLAWAGWAVARTRLSTPAAHLVHCWICYRIQDRCLNRQPQSLWNVNGNGMPLGVHGAATPTRGACCVESR